MIKVNCTIDAALGHRLHNDRAKPAPLWRRHRRPSALGPAHGESVAIGAPADIDTTPIRRECPVFAGVGGEFVQRKPDGLRGSRLQTQLGAAQGDTGINEVGKMRELGANQICYIDPVPFVPDE